MWNSEQPLNLLLSMPNTLNKENLENLQAVIDVDKMINSQLNNRDLCGEYAPFCDFCDKNLQYPCAHAYVKMKQSEGLDVEVSQEVFDDQTQSEQTQPEEQVQLEQIPPEQSQPEQAQSEEQADKCIRICKLVRKR